METATMKLADLCPAPYNPRVDLKPGDEAYESPKRSIETFGYVEPIIYNKRTGNVVGGHQRLKVMLDMGMDEAECVVVDLHENDEKALNVALNKISGDWDMPKLKDLLEELDNGAYDMELTGFNLDEIEDLMTQYAQDAEGITSEDDDFDADAAAKDIAEPSSKRGDVWVIGNHRVMCGDATDPNDVEVLMDGALADILITDPPYNVNYEGTAGKIQNDNMSDDEFRAFLSTAFFNADSHMRPGAAFYIWHADSEGYNFRGACRDVGWQVRQCLIWNKNSLVLGRQDYQWKHEPCLYGWKEGAAHFWGSDRCQTTVLDFDRPSRSEEHPTMKPIPLFAYQISNSSERGSATLDLFAGSGTALIASEQAARRSYSMELDPRYCDVIVLRYLKFTGSDGNDVKLIRNGHELPCPKEISNKIM